MKEQDEIMKQKIFSHLVSQRRAETDREKIDDWEWAEYLNNYCKENGLSQRQAAGKFNIPHSTFNNWCAWSRIPQNKYEELKAKGMRDSDFRRTLKRGKAHDHLLLESKVPIDYHFREATLILRRHTSSHIEMSSDTRELYEELKKLLSHIEMRMERNASKKW